MRVNVLFRFGKPGGQTNARPTDRNDILLRRILLNNGSLSRLAVLLDFRRAESPVHKHSNPQPTAAGSRHTCADTWSGQDRIGTSKNRKSNRESKIVICQDLVGRGRTWPISESLYAAMRR